MPESYRDEFLTLLNNRPPDGSPGTKPRSQGFVVSVPGQKSLAPLQSLCFEQKYNTCFTARYRVDASAVFGTVFVALANDLLSPSSSGDLRGIFRPDFSDLMAQDQGAWLGRSTTLAALEQIVSAELRAGEEGVIQAGIIQEVLHMVDGLTFESVGNRFVLFIEVIGDGHNDQEWAHAKSTFLSSLPERTGIVLSGAPASFNEVLANSPELETVFEKAGAA